MSAFGSLADRAIFPLTVVAIPICALLICLFGLWMIIAAPTYVRGVECNVLFTIQKTLAGHSLYTDPNDLPYDVAQYSPLYYLVCKCISHLFDISPSNPMQLSAVARGVSFGCSLLTAFVLYHIQVSTLRTPRRFAVVATSFAFVSCSPWLFLARPDALKCLLFTGSIAALLNVERTHGATKILCLITSALLAVGAIAAKQDGVFAVAILLASLAAAGRGRDFLIATTVVIAIGAFPVFAASSVWPFLFDNVVDGVNNGVSLGNAISKTYARTLSNFAFPLALGFAVAIKWARLPPADRTLAHTTLLVALLGTFTGAVVTGVKAGSGEGYFNDAIILLSVAVCWFLSSKTCDRDRDKMLLTAVACFLLVFLPFWTAKQWYDYYWWQVVPSTSVIYPVNTSFSSSGFKSVATFVRHKMKGNSDGVVISWDLAMNNFLPEYCILPQKEVIQLMQKQGVIDLAAFERCVRDGRLKYGVRHSDTLPDELFGVPLPSSEVVFREGSTRVFKFAEQQAL